MGTARAQGVGGVQRGKAIQPDASPPRRTTRRTVDAPPSSAADPDPESPSVEQEVEEDVVKSRKMTWSMLVPGADGVIGVPGSVGVGAAGEYHAYSAESDYLQPERDEREEVEKASAQAKNVDDVLWFSDTTATRLSDCFQTRIKSFADGATADLSSTGVAHRSYKSFHDMKEEGAATAPRRCAAQFYRTIFCLFLIRQPDNITH